MMTEMEEDIYERAFIHWKEKRKMKIENGDNEIKEYWDDYFSGNPLYS